MSFFANSFSDKKESVQKAIKTIICSIYCLFFVFLIIYAVSDLLTSRQTYHYDNPDRTVSKVTIIVLNVLALLSVFFGWLLDKKVMRAIFDNLIYVISFASILLSIIISFFLNNHLAADSLFTALIYPISFFLFSLCFLILPQLKVVPFNLIKASILFIFYLYLLFCVFYYFYVFGKPMSSGGLRIPTISHVFFCCSLIPLLRLILKDREMLIVYLSFLPISILADKASVLIIFFAYSFTDLFKYLSGKLNKKTFHIIVLLIIIALIATISISNIFTNTFLFEHFSFDAIIIKSGRLQNWSVIIEGLKTFDFTNYLFGKGIGATLSINNGVAAHNDYLEFLYDYGILGLSSLILLISHFCLQVKRVEGKEGMLLLFYVLTITTISSLFSNSNLLLSFSFILQGGFYFNEKTTYLSISI